MPERLPRITAAALINALHRAGWQRVRQSGSHVRLHHPERAVGVTIAVHPARIVKPGTLRGVLDQAGMSVDDLLRYL